MKKRIIRMAAAILAAIPFLKCNANALTAEKAILMDAQTGRVIYEKAADSRSLIASTTKILTALVAIREGKLSDVITVSQSAAATEGSSMYLKAGEKLTLETLLYGLLLCSGNDAAVAIADAVGVS